MASAAYVINFVRLVRELAINSEFFYEDFSQLGKSIRKLTIDLPEKLLSKHLLYETCSKLTIKRPERRQRRHSGLFFVNSEQISYIVLVFTLLTLNK